LSEPTPEPVNPWRNPSYPQRVHIHERAKWNAVLASCEERLDAARQKLVVVGNSPARVSFERLLGQLMGARDQVAEAARRLPGETGELYEEDKHRLEEAVAAFDRVHQQWGSSKA
jgi:hypothetical protein